MTTTAEQQPSNHIDRKRTVLGLEGVTQTIEVSEAVRIGEEKVSLPLENEGTPVSRYIQMEKKLADEDTKAALAKLGPDATAEEIAEITGMIGEEVRNWQFLTQLLQDNRNAFHIIDEKAAVSFPDDPMRGMSFMEYAQLRNIPTEGIEKYFLCTMKDTQKLEELEQAGLVGGLRVKKLFNTLENGEQNVGVEVRLENQNGDIERFVFLFAESAKAAQKVEPANSEEKEKGAHEDGGKTESAETVKAAA